MTGFTKLKLIQSRRSRDRVLSTRRARYLMNGLFPRGRRPSTGTQRQSFESINGSSEYCAGRKNLVEFTYRPSVFWVLLILNRVTWLLLAFFRAEAHCASLLCSCSGSALPIFATMARRNERESTYAPQPAFSRHCRSVAFMRHPKKNRA